MAFLFTAPKFTAFDSSGNPLAGGKVYTYAAGTLTPKATYTNQAGNVVNTNPVILDASGCANIWLGSGGYKFVVTDASDEAAPFGTVDNISGVATADEIASASEADKGAGMVGYGVALSYVQGTVGAKLKSLPLDLDDMPGATDHAKMTYGVALAGATGRALRMPARRIDIDSNLGSIILEEVTLVGENVLDGANGTVDVGAVFWITGTTNAPFKIRRGVVIDGLAFYYPDQADSATPTVYPPTLDFDFTDGSVQFVYIQNCTALNSYRWLRINDAVGNVGHVWITDNTVCGISRCIEITKNLETVKITGNTFTFGHWLAATEAGTREYIRENAICIDYLAGDGVIISDNLIYGYRVGIRNTSGLAVVPSITNNIFDNVLFAIIVDNTGQLSQATISGNSFICYNSQDTTQTGWAITINSSVNAQSANIANNQFLAVTESHIVLNTTAQGKIAVVSNIFEGAGHEQASGTFASIKINCPNFNILFDGNYVQGQGNAIVYGVFADAVNNMHMSDNHFTQCAKAVRIATAGSLVMVGNASYATYESTSDDIDVVAGMDVRVANAWDKAENCGIEEYADDAAAATGGIAIGQQYRTGSVLKIRVA